jgi:phenylpropionate dioxygenase-like ring-hydroxylating dioxygenase large terminal subunit
VCRHRAGPPAEGCGSRKLFRCAYHGWTYDLDGTLISATEIEGVKGFRAEDFALTPVRTEEWFNLVFVNLDPEAQPLLQTLSELPRQTGKFSFTKMTLFERRTYDMKCNWKAYVDNYLEGYHLPSVHPGLNRELDFNSYVVEPHSGYVRQFSPIRGTQPGDTAPRRYQQGREDLTTDYFWVFPNWMLNCYPDNVSLNIVLPIGPERTMAIFEWYLPEKNTSHLLLKRRWNSAIRFKLRMSGSAKPCKRICDLAVTRAVDSASNRKREFTLFIACTPTSCVPKWLKTTSVGQGRPIPLTILGSYCCIPLLSH